MKRFGEDFVAVNPFADYTCHRLTIEVGMDKVACDCGEPFNSVVDLERHQQAFRHPGINSGWEQGVMT